jgi:hypothetical protein
LHPLQSERAILLTAMKEMLDLADSYRNNRIPTTKTAERARYFTLEAARIGIRLLKVQKEIEDNDLD